MPSRDPIRVTDHALERARERHADLRTMQERHLLQHINREVGDALRAHRYAKTAPRQLLRPPLYDVRAKADRGGRYVWNESLTRAYIVKRVDGGTTWLVVTVLDTIHSRAA